MLPVIRKMNIEPLNTFYNFRNLSQVFDELWPEEPLTVSTTSHLDMYEDKDFLYIEADLPGFERKDITLILEEDALRIEAQRQVDQEHKESHYFIQERMHYKFSRTVRLPLPVEEKQIDADLKEGLLKITLTKTLARERYKTKVNWGKTPIKPKLTKGV